MHSIRKALLLMVLSSLSMPLMAEDADKATEVEIDTAADEAVVELDAFEGSATLSDEELGSHRARENIEVESITLNNQDQDGDVTDNVAIGTTSGDNLISGDAFSNSSGFLSTVQNSGNNVLIQNSTIINVSVEAPTN